ncbi:MAG: hypothetical protein QNJ54_18410 [Prochloraceae cyanobacterium]|nr:hypothetical protein [Prochloraceae cyanobacterium]
MTDEELFFLKIKDKKIFSREIPKNIDMDIDIAFFYMEKIKNLFKSNEWNAIKEAREEIVDVIRAYL